MLRFDFNNAMSELVSSRHGIAWGEIKSLQAEVHQIHKELRQKRKNREIGFFDLPYDRTLVGAVHQLATQIRKQAENFVVLGIGGSALGAIALFKALCHPYHNLIKRPRLFFLDNSDPEPVAKLLEAVDLNNTIFNVISKSGKTAEALASFMFFYNRVARHLGKNRVNQHFLITTELADGPLHSIAREEKIKTLPIPENVGGRFSVLSAVGLLPAAVAGINVSKLLDGAQAMDRRLAGYHLSNNLAYLNAAIHYLAYQKKGKKISVMMPYSNCLYGVADWYRQLWAESLGKLYDLRGEQVAVGQTPIKALGATDQHSQLQLYLEGPNDKIFTFLQVNKFRHKAYVPRLFSNRQDFHYLTGKNMSALINNELKATEYVLTKNKRPNVKIILDTVDPFTIGQLLYMLEVQTAFAGGLFNINPFDQPAVEQIKVMVNTFMGVKDKKTKQSQKGFQQYQQKRKHRCL